jgi:hypothetical protein
MPSRADYGTFPAGLQANPIQIRANEAALHSNQIRLPADRLRLRIFHRENGF